MREISRLADALRQTAAGHMDGAHTATVAKRQKDLVAELRRTDDALRERFGAIRRESDALAEEVTRTAGEITFHAAVGEAMDELAAALDEVAAQARRIVPPDEDLGRSERLTEMLGRYTMEVERIVHQQALAGAGKTAREREAEDGRGDGVSADQAEASSEFGDNVELF